MSRKPMDKLNGFDSREAMWKLIRDWKAVTVKDLCLKTGMEPSSVRDYLRGLTNAGYMEEDSTNKAAVFTLVRDAGIDAPRVRKDGSRVVQGQGRINMWRTMRILRRFSATELAVSSSTENCEIQSHTASDYINHLCRAGYLRYDGNGSYFFMEHMFTGPKPPMVQRVKRVWDQNLKQVMWSEDGGNDD